MKTVDAGGRLISVITDHPRTHALHSAILLKHVGGTAVLFDVCTRCNSSSLFRDNVNHFQTFIAELPTRLEG